MPNDEIHVDTLPFWEVQNTFRHLPIPASYGHICQLQRQLF